VNGQLEVDETFVTIQRHGPIARASHSGSGESRFPITGITEVQLKMPSMGQAGFVFFRVSGLTTVPMSLQAAITDEHAV
jgi:hypothetical protein